MKPFDLISNDNDENDVISAFEKRLELILSLDAQELVERIEFESEDDYYQKLVTLRESYFPRNAGIPANETENLSEEANFQEVTHSPSMDAYLRALSNVAKK